MENSPFPVARSLGLPVAASKLKQSRWPPIYLAGDHVVHERQERQQRAQRRPKAHRRRPRHQHKSRQHEEWQPSAAELPSESCCA